MKAVTIRAILIEWLLKFGYIERCEFCGRINANCVPQNKDILDSLGLLSERIKG